MYTKLWIYHVIGVGFLFLWFLIYTFFSLLSILCFTAIIFHHCNCNLDIFPLCFVLQFNCWHLLINCFYNLEAFVLSYLAFDFMFFCSESCSYNWLIHLYSGIDLSRWRELLKQKGLVADLEKFTQHVHGNHFIPNTVLVDCTADSNVASCYHDWLCKGIHVITPNKKANSGPLDKVISILAWQFWLLELVRVQSWIFCCYLKYIGHCKLPLIH